MSYYGSIYEFVDKELWSRLRGIPKVLIATATGGTRSSQSSRILTVKLGLSTASAHSLGRFWRLRKFARARRAFPESLLFGFTQKIRTVSCTHRTDTEMI